MISASAVALSRFFSSKESRSFWKGLASAAMLCAFCIRVERGREGGKGGIQLTSIFYYNKEGGGEGGREGGREGTHSPPTYLRNVGNAEAALEGGVAEEECLADGEEVG